MGNLNQVNYKITKGFIEVSHVEQLIDYPDVKIFELSVNTKYPEVSLYQGTTVWFQPSVYSPIKTPINGEVLPTGFTPTLRSANWQIAVRDCRYELTIIYFDYGDR